MIRSKVLLWCLLLLGVSSLLLAAVAGDPPAGGGRLVGGQIAATTNGTTTVPGGSTFTAGSGFKEMTVVLNITASGADAGTLQLYLQDSADGGTTWNDLIAMVPFTFGSPVTTQRYYLTTGFHSTYSGQMSRMQGQPQVTETLLPGTVRQAPWGNRLRVRESIANIAGTPTGPTYNVDVLLK